MRNTTVHYVIKLRRPSPAKSWFEMAKRLEASAKRHGLTFREFNNDTEFDRNHVQQVGQWDHFEGFIHNAPSNWREMLEQAITEADIGYEYLDAG